MNSEKWIIQNLLFANFEGGVNIKQELPINEKIRFKEVQVIDEQGQKLGTMSSNEALDLAYDKKLDLVLVAPNGNPPVCKIMNYGKYKFEQAKKEKEAKKKQKVYELKEIRVTPNTEEHDFNFKTSELIINEFEKSKEYKVSSSIDPFL